MISNQIELVRGIDRPVGMTLFDVRPREGKSLADLSDSTAYFIVENEAMTGTLVDAVCDIDGDPTLGRVIWTPIGTEFAGLTYEDDTPKRVRTYVRVVRPDGPQLYPMYGGYSNIWADIPLTP